MIKHEDLATHKYLKAKVKQAKSKLVEAEIALNAYIQQNIMVVCGYSPPHGRGCGKKTSIGKLTYHQTYWYDDKPYCESFPKEGEGFTICPKCGQKLRFIEGTGNENMSEYKSLFGERVDEDPS